MHWAWGGEHTRGAWGQGSGEGLPETGAHPCPSPAAEAGQHQHHVQVLKLLLQDDAVGLQARQLRLQPLLLALQGVPGCSRPASPRQQQDTPGHECVST